VNSVKTMSPPPQEPAFLPLVKSVSRSFYLSLRLLPPAVRVPASLGYMLARASDTLADASAHPVAARRTWLLDFERAIHHPSLEPWSLPPEARQVDHPGEALLLQHLPTLLQWLAEQPETERHLIRTVLHPILAGQLEDLDRPRLLTPEALHHYTWQVAGCVGEFWTDLHLHLVPGFATAPPAQLRAWGRRLGCGLQLINILRDVPKDAALGRTYLPDLASAAQPPIDIPADVRWAAAQPWITACRAHLAAGAQYAQSVRPARCAAAVWLPQRLAQSTLDLIERTGPAAMVHPVKISRPIVRRELWAAMLSSWK
jgi:farnesyl-diphosphate farnesyltransferase